MHRGGSLVGTQVPSQRTYRALGRDRSCGDRNLCARFVYEKSAEIDFRNNFNDFAKKFFSGDCNVVPSDDDVHEMLRWAQWSPTPIFAANCVKVSRAITFITKHYEEIEAACKKPEINKILRSAKKYSAILHEPTTESLVQIFDAIFVHQPGKAEGHRTRCLNLAAEVESAIGTILQARVNKLEVSIRHLSESCVSFSAGSDKELLGSDADFMKGINTDKLHKAMLKAAADREELIECRADLNDPRDGVDILHESEKLVCKAKGQINRAAIIQLVGRPTIEHKAKGKELRAQLLKVIKTVDRLNLQDHVGKSLLAQARILTEDKHANLTEEGAEATPDTQGAGAVKRQRATEDSESLPSTKEKKKAR